MQLLPLEKPSLYGSYAPACYALHYAMLQCSNKQPNMLNIMLMRKLVPHFVPDPGPEPTVQVVRFWPDHCLVGVRALF